jgi:hypothetical protein
MPIEEDRQDVLQNIEFVVTSLYRRHPELTDHAVLRTYEALIQMYSAEVTGRAKAVRVKAPSGLEAELLSDVRAMCELRLGRETTLSVEGGTPRLEALDIPTLILCLKRLVKSVQTWNKQGGRQGYLTFMTQFQP